MAGGSGPARQVGSDQVGWVLLAAAVVGLGGWLWAGWLWTGGSASWVGHGCSWLRVVAFSLLLPAGSRRVALGVAQGGWVVSGQVALGVAQVGWLVALGGWLFKVAGWLWAGGCGRLRVVACLLLAGLVGPKDLIACLSTMLDIRLYVHTEFRGLHPLCTPDSTTIWQRFASGSPSP